MKTTLTKQERRGLLNLGMTQLIDLDMYLYLLARITNENRVIKFVHKEFLRDYQSTYSDSSLSLKSTYRILARLKRFGLITVQMAGCGEVLLEVKNVHEMFCPKAEEKTDVSKPDPEKPCDSNVASKSPSEQQQHLVEIKKICTSAGVNYRLEKDWWEIVSHGYKKVRATIDRMLLQISTGRTVIHNPCGWLKVALRDNYYLDTPESENPAIYERMLFFAQEKLLDLTGCVPKKNVTHRPT